MWSTRCSAGGQVRGRSRPAPACTAPPRLRVPLPARRALRLLCWLAAARCELDFPSRRRVTSGARSTPAQTPPVSRSRVAITPECACKCARIASTLPTSSSSTARRKSGSCMSSTSAIVLLQFRQRGAQRSFQRSIRAQRQEFGDLLRSAGLLAAAGVDFREEELRQSVVLRVKALGGQ